MFSWATKSLESLAQTVAPPPTDPASKFVFACNRGDEAEALALVPSLDPAAVIQAQKGHTVLHVACLNALPGLVAQLLQASNAMHAGQAHAGLMPLSATDTAGNTCLHCACMANRPAALEVVKLLVSAPHNAAVAVKNLAGQTPYDVAVLNTVRQYLLPIQLQAETQAALDNGGVGLPAGIDLGGMKISNPNLAPPPTGVGPPTGTASSGGGGGHARYPETPGLAAAPQLSVPNATVPQLPSAAGKQVPAATATMFATPSPQQQAVDATAAPPQQAAPPAPSTITATSPAETTTSPPRIPSAPSSTGSSYALRGQSSANVLKNNKYQPDGFHSSSSDKNLQEKYGHVKSTAAVPPPPSSGNSVGLTLSAPPSMGAPTSTNPYAGGRSAMAGRYPTYDMGNRSASMNLPTPPAGRFATPGQVAAPGQFGTAAPIPGPAPGKFEAAAPAAAPGQFGTAATLPASAPSFGSPFPAPPTPFGAAEQPSAALNTPFPSPPAAANNNTSFAQPPFRSPAAFGTTPANTPVTTPMTTPLAKPVPEPTSGPSFLAPYQLGSRTTSTGRPASAVFGAAPTAGAPPAPSPSKFSQAQRTTSSELFARPALSSEKSTVLELPTNSNDALGTEAPEADMTTKAGAARDQVPPVGNCTNKSPVKSASALFGSPEEKATTAPNKVSDEGGEGDMDEIPLTPGAVSNPLVAAIGMPPPPFSKK